MMQEGTVTLSYYVDSEVEFRVENEELLFAKTLFETLSLLNRQKTL